MGESSSFETASAAVSQTAMVSGSDDGEPGEHLAEPPLQQDERELLDQLARPGRPVVHPAEDSAAATAAAEDDSALPVETPEQAPDPLTPQFRELPEA